MNEENRNESKSWDDIGKQFEQLGKNLGDAFSSAWKDENNRKKLQEVENSVIDILDTITNSVREEIESPKAQETIQNIKSEVEKAAPHLEEALQTANLNLQNWITKMNKKE